MLSIYCEMFLSVIVCFILQTTSCCDPNWPSATSMKYLTWHFESTLQFKRKAPVAWFSDYFFHTGVSIKNEIQHNGAVNSSTERLTQIANQPITRQRLSSSSFLRKLSPKTLKETTDFLCKSICLNNWSCWTHFTLRHESHFSICSIWRGCQCSVEFLLYAGHFCLFPEQN